MVIKKFSYNLTNLITERKFNLTFCSYHDVDGDNNHNLHRKDILPLVRTSRLFKLGERRPLDLRFYILYRWVSGSRPCSFCHSCRDYTKKRVNFTIRVRNIEK